MTYMYILHFTTPSVRTRSAWTPVKKVMGYDLMSPFPLELVEKQMAFAGVDKLVLLGEDCAAEDGAVLSNEEISRIVSLDPNRFIGFATVDPNRPDAFEPPSPRI